VFKDQNVVGCRLSQSSDPWHWDFLRRFSKPVLKESEKKAKVGIGYEAKFVVGLEKKLVVITE
jgi:hypothetical protein